MCNCQFSHYAYDYTLLIAILTKRVIICCNQSMTKEVFASDQMEQFEWAHLAETARQDPEGFLDAAIKESIRDPDAYVEEVIELGTSAAWEISIANQGLVRYVAKKYNKSGEHPTLNFDDLVSVGSVALFESTGKYLPFSDQLSPAYFLVTGIKAGINRYVANSQSTVRIPTSTRMQLRRIEALVMHRDPTTGQGISPSRAFEIAGLDGPKTKRRLEMAKLIGDEMGSLENGFSPRIDNPSGNDYSPRMSSIFSEEGNSELDGAEKVGLIDLLSALVDEAAHNLHPGIDRERAERAREIVFKRIGFNTERQTQTLEEVGREFGITRGRVMQIQAEMLAKIRRLARDKKYHGLIIDVLDL